jgi:ubiquinone/menaquinone biosynthesis C-methylase UbiE
VSGPRIPPEGGFHNYFGPQASRYREYRPQYPAALFEYLTRVAGGTEVAWDCATGNGQAAVQLADHFASVTATDPSGEMIAHAIPHPRVAYSVAKYESGLPDHGVNLVTVAQALHWFDIEPFVREVRRVLAPHGVLAVWCYSKCSVNAAVDEVVGHFYGVTLRPFWAKERRFVDEGYRNIALPLDELAPPAFEMIEHWSLPEFAAYIRTWSAVNKLVEHGGEEPVRAFEEALATTWGAPQQRRPVQWPLHVRVGGIR